MTTNSIVAAGNTYNPCVMLLHEGGYRVWAVEGSENVIWNAEKNGVSYLAYSPPELLGIVTLWEKFGENWNRQSPNLIGEILGEMEDSP